ncbi:beta-4C adrenergic receptor-like [Actinia tenebrosa]|uniref:Beta-4C adrenergic receptor-like n=1 Tax=Actinia tenebrosa TaxID=6105 RepID=A0A6P8HSZ7_ACTTE|nr:beta-4C adrenergic receptor-like [Actinia tenebrosa]
MPNQSNNASETLVSVFYTTHLVSFVLMVFLSITTVVGNGLLLLATWKDPFRSFRNPTSILVASLGFADFLTGLIVDPLAASINLMAYLKRLQVREDQIYKQIASFSFSFSLVTMNASFMTVLALTCIQVIAVSSPHEYKDKITKLKCLICVVCIWGYTTLFSLLPVMGVSTDITAQLDLHINTSTVLLALVLAYAFLYRSYRTHLDSESMRRSGTSQFQRRRNRRQFTLLNLLLAAFVIVFSLPIEVLGHLKFYWTSSNPNQRLKYLIAYTIAGDIILLKFALDPFAYALRLPKYRLAFKNILYRSSYRVPQSSHLGPPLRSSYEFGVDSRVTGNEVKQLGVSVKEDKTVPSELAV